MLRRLLVVCLVVVLGGCALFRDLVQPEVRLTSVALEPGGGLQPSLKIGVRVTNPNAFALKLANLNYRIMLEGREVARGDYRDRLEIAANGSADFTVPVTLNLLNGAALLQSMLNQPDKKELEYGLEVDADVKTWGIGPMKLRRSSKIPLTPP